MSLFADGVLGLTIVAIGMKEALTAYHALLAKRRAKLALRDAAWNETRAQVASVLKQLQESDVVTDDFMRRELVDAILVLEAALVQLPDQDRRFVQEGLHQKSLIGRRRFMAELVAA